MTIDPIVLANGMKVSVEFPPRVPTVCPPSVPQPGPITVPVQGGLTAEQLAHIVATVTAKVVEELGGQPGSVSWDAVQDKPAVFPPAAHRHNASDIDDLPSGGGGAGIDDTTISTDTTWSSQKTSDELADKADDNWVMLDPETGEPIPGTDMPLSVGLDTTWLTALGIAAGLGMRLEVENQLESGPNQGFMLTLVREMPSDPFPNTICALVAPDGSISLHLRNLGG